MLRVHFLRHGQTAMSRENRFCGAIDPELTPDGVAMAEAFAHANRDVAWRAVYSSPMRRTLATAAPLCAARGLEPVVREGLREIGYGQWEGKTPEDVDATSHDEYLRWLADPGWNAPVGGESAVTISNRAMAVVDEIQKHYDTGDVLVVSHKATIRIMVCALLGVDVGRFRFRLGCPVGSVSVVEFGRHGPLVASLADRIHLDERLRNLPGT